MGQLRGLIDTNVLVALVDPEHLHHQHSLDVTVGEKPESFAVALHSLTEFFHVATRQSPRGLGLKPLVAQAFLDDHISAFSIIGLSIEEHFATVRQFATTGRGGPQVYDYLIGQLAVLYNIPLIITWNVKHMAPLFPLLTVVTPTQFIKES
jgi:predicted nucleic acid-binding protein